MHQTRAEVSKKISIPRKGTKYVARSLGSLKNSLPVVIAVRDMLNLARTAAEVKKMIHKKLLKINGREVNDYREAINLFSIFEADKTYGLFYSPDGKFILKETKDKERLCKVINKKILKGKKTQLNLNDGSNVLSDKPIQINDTLYLDFQGKITKHVSIEKGKHCLIISGKYIGKSGKIEHIDNGNVSLKIEGVEKPHSLEKSRIFAI